MLLLETVAIAVMASHAARFVSHKDILHLVRNVMGSQSILETVANTIHGLTIEFEELVFLHELV